MADAKRTKRPGIRKKFKPQRDALGRFAAKIEHGPAYVAPADRIPAQWVNPDLDALTCEFDERLKGEVSGSATPLNWVAVAVAVALGLCYVIFRLSH